MEHHQSSNSHVCSDHDNEPITNFCSHIDCLKPLCPECIDDHNKHHHSQNTLPQISSLKNAKSNCAKKIKAALAALHQELDNPLLTAIVDPQNAIREEIKKVNELREKLNDIIQHYLVGLESNLKKNINKSHSNSNDALEVIEKFKNHIAELESLHKDIHSNNSLGVLKKICGLDLKTMMNKLKADLTRALQKRSTEGVAIVFDESYLDHFKDVLSKLIGLSKETDLQKNNLPSNFTSPQKASNFSHFSYFFPIRSILINIDFS